jgi:hypothetical protein
MAERKMPSKENGETVVQGDKVMVVDYPSNANAKKMQNAAAKEKDEPEKASVPEGYEKPPEGKSLDKIVSGKVVARKKGIGRKIVDTFTGGESMDVVGNYLVFDVALPALKNLVSDMVSQGIERALFGESARRGAATRTIGRSFTNYGSYSSKSPTGRAGESDSPRSLGSRSRAVHDFREIVLENRGEAEEVIDTLREAVQQYQVATVGDLYDLVGVTPKFTDQKWGWSDLRDAGVERVRDGYLLRLPRTEPLD